MEDKIKILENNCINGVEDAFNDYLVNDVCETGGVNDLFTKTDVYLFWLENAWEVNRMIDLMVSESTLSPLFKRAIILKRIIDENLVKYGPAIEDIRRDLELYEDERSMSLIELNIHENRIEEFIKFFHKILIDEGLSNSSLNDFTSNFINRDNSAKPINWLGKLSELAGLIKYLTDKGIFKLPPNKTKSVLIKEHFRINNNIINSGSLRVTLSTAEIKDHPQLFKLSVFKAR